MGGTKIHSVEMETVESFIISRCTEYYPGAALWYSTKVLPQLGKDKEIIRTNCGFAIIKYSEKKICTLYVFERYRGTGAGMKLFEKCFKALGTRKPYLTVSEESLPLFRRLFIHYDFTLSRHDCGRYRPGKYEYIFNESIKN